MATEPTNAGPDTRALIKKWAALHAGRTALGFAATLIFLGINELPDRSFVMAPWAARAEQRSQEFTFFARSNERCARGEPVSRTFNR